MSIVELRRLFSEWRIRMARVQEVLQPRAWAPEEWNEFARTVTLITQKYGKHWTAGEPETRYYDLRWDLSEGGQLVCQFEDTANTKKSLVVAQYGGFADGTENYIWFYCEFNERGEFIGDPYWVDGNWKDALAMVLMPHKMAAGFYLQDAGAPIQQHLLQQGAACAPVPEPAVYKQAA